MGDFDATREDAFGVKKDTMLVSITNLDDLKIALDEWNIQLLELRDLVIADWYGNASDQFQESYDQLANTMFNMIHYAMLLRDYSIDTVELYSNGDHDVSEDVYIALGRRNI